MEPSLWLRRFLPMAFLPMALQVALAAVPVTWNVACALLDSWSYAASRVWNAAAAAAALLLASFAPISLLMVSRHVVRRLDSADGQHDGQHNGHHSSGDHVHVPV
jgi:divalent metal cation (Fe/Co/Zn/Cd) transporter